MNKLNIYEVYNCYRVRLDLILINFIKINKEAYYKWIYRNKMSNLLRAGLLGLAYIATESQAVLIQDKLK